MGSARRPLGLAATIVALGSGCHHRLIYRAYWILSADLGVAPYEDTPRKRRVSASVRFDSRGRLVSRNSATGATSASRRYKLVSVPVGHDISWVPSPHFTRTVKSLSQY
ncbi:hypothetical protein ISCGN_004287 [Ixodes scapularis]